MFEGKKRRGKLCNQSIYKKQKSNKILICKHKVHDSQGNMNKRTLLVMEMINHTWSEVTLQTPSNKSSVEQALKNISRPLKEKK